MMCDGVSKSGSPISRCTTERPLASSARALTRTSKAVSWPMWSIRSAGWIAIGVQGSNAVLRRAARTSSGRPLAPVTIPNGRGKASVADRKGLKYIWRTLPRAPQELFAAVREVHPAMVQVMYGRGLEAPDRCADFLAGVCRDPDDPNLLKDEDQAVE